MSDSKNEIGKLQTENAPEIPKSILNRFSTRQYDSTKAIPENILAELKKQIQMWNSDDNPFHTPVTLALVGDVNLCSYETGCQVFVAAGIEGDNFNTKGSAALGYVLEKVIMWLTDHDLGTCWMAGTVNRPAILEKLGLSPASHISITPVGYPATPLPSTHQRHEYSYFFRKETLDGQALTPAESGVFEHALESVRLAPTAINCQDVRVVVETQHAHFYVHCTMDHTFLHWVDAGIAMAHFDDVIPSGGWMIEVSDENQEMKKKIGDAVWVASWNMTV